MLALRKTANGWSRLSTGTTSKHIPKHGTRKSRGDTRGDMRGSMTEFLIFREEYEGIRGEYEGLRGRYEVQCYILCMCIYEQGYEGFC